MRQVCKSSIAQTKRRLPIWLHSRKHHNTIKPAIVSLWGAPWDLWKETLALDEDYGNSKLTPCWWRLDLLSLSRTLLLSMYHGERLYLTVYHSPPHACAYAQEGTSTGWRNNRLQLLHGQKESKERQQWHYCHLIPSQYPAIAWTGNCLPSTLRVAIPLRRQMAGLWPPANPTKTTKQRAAQVREYHAIGIDSSHVGAMTLKKLVSNGISSQG